MFALISAILATSPFLAPNDPLLRQRADELSKREMLSEETSSLVQKMKQIVNERIHEMMGLAAPQIGVSKRIILVNFNGLIKVYFNPQIIWKSKETLAEDESLAAKIKLCAYNEKGELIVEEFENMEARTFQHEVGLLNID